MQLSDLSNAERETMLNMVADNRAMWNVYSDDPVMQRKLERIGAVVIKTETHGGKHYELPANQVSFRRPPKPMSKERKAELAAQLAASR